MTILEFVNTFLYGYDGQEKVQFDKVVAILEHMADMGVGGTQELEADTVGLAQIEAGAGFVVVTVKTAATDIIHLPPVAECKVGHIVRGHCAATGCEIRVAVADDTTVYLNNNNTTVNEAALAAGASFEAHLVSATRWVLFNYSNAGAITSPTPD